MALDSWMYRNPMLVLQDKQEHEARQRQRKCDGCVNKASVWGMDYCIENRCQPGAKMRRCPQYKEQQS